MNGYLTIEHSDWSIACGINSHPLIVVMRESNSIEAWLDSCGIHRLAWNQRWYDIIECFVYGERRNYQAELVL